MVRPSVIARTLVFVAVEPLLDDQAVAGLAEDPPDHDLVDALEGLAEVVADEDALAGGQAVGLEHQAQRAAQDEVARLGGRAEDALLAALLDLDLHARAEHLARVHDPVDGLERLGRRSGSGACGGSVERPRERTISATSREST